MKPAGHHKSNVDFNYLMPKVHCIRYESESSDYDDQYCSTIISTRVPINVNNSYYLASSLTRNKALRKDLRFYCLERMLSCLLRANPDCFKVNIQQGYYGEETNGVSISNNVVSSANEFIKKLNYGSGKEYNRSLVEEVLRAEYGYLLPALENKDWNIDKIPIVSIKPGNEVYHGSNIGSINQYSEEYAREKDDWLSCLCRKSGIYTLVDGYHRFAAAGKRGDKYMTVVWCDV